MKPFTPRSLLILTATAAAAWLVAASAALCVGSTGLHVSATLADDRLPIVLLASVVGAGLGAAGVVYQSVLRNPLADPYLLGVSSGAALGSYLWHTNLDLGAVATSLGQTGLSLAAAAASVAVVFALSTRRGRLEPVTLLLVGVVVNSINGSIFLLLDALNPDRAAARGGSMAILVGTLQTSLSKPQLVVAAAVVLIGYGTLAALAGRLSVARLSDAEATALGLSVNRLRWVALILASAMTAAVVAVSGPIGFVGLVGPHVARSLVGSDPRRSLPVATAAGAILLVFADGSARWFSQPALLGSILPVGVITALAGGPFFLTLLFRERHQN